MGAAVGAQARAAGATVLWCTQGRSEASARRAHEAGLSPVSDLPNLLDRASIVLSICPPAAAPEVAAEVSRAGFTGVYVDANAISPTRSQEIQATITAAGMRFVDGGIIGPPPHDGATARLYLAGASTATDALAAIFRGSLIEPVVLPNEPPAASALKMAYASYQKATRVLAATAHALARHHGVRDHLLREGRLLDPSALADVDHLPSVAARAWRWAPELRDVASALNDVGLPDGLAAATAEILDRWEPFKDDRNASLEDALDRLIEHPEKN
jgi:3-hydroxyisobutyrate dehydrogenase-like beta-hydroxyacid dehydrogenase